MDTQNRIIRNGRTFQLKMNFLDQTRQCVLWDMERSFPDDVIILESPLALVPNMKSFYVRDGFDVKDHRHPLR